MPTNIKPKLINTSQAFRGKYKINKIPMPKPINIPAMIFLNFLNILPS